MLTWKLNTLLPASSSLCAATSMHSSSTDKPTTAGTCRHGSAHMPWQTSQFTARGLLQTLTKTTGVNCILSQLSREGQCFVVPCGSYCKCSSIACWALLPDRPYTGSCSYPAVMLRHPAPYSACDVLRRQPRLLLGDLRLPGCQR